MKVIESVGWSYAILWKYIYTIMPLLHWLQVAGEEGAAGKPAPKAESIAPENKNEAAPVTVPPKEGENPSPASKPPVMPCL